MKGLWIYTVISVLALGIVIFPKSEAEYYDYLKEQLENSNAILIVTNDLIFKLIKRDAEDYPQYWNFLKNAESVNSTVNEFIKKTNNQLLTMNNDFIDLIENESGYNIKDEKEQLRKLLYHFEDSFNIVTSLNNSLLKSTVLANEMVMMNYFASKMRRGCGFSSDEIYTSFSSNISIINQPFKTEFYLVNGGEKFRIDKLIINEEEVKVLYSQAKFKQKATKKGWNEINVLVEGTLFDKRIQKEKTFRYYVK